MRPFERGSLALIKTKKDGIDPGTRGGIHPPPGTTPLPDCGCMGGGATPSLLALALWTPTYPADAHCRRDLLHGGDRWPGAREGCDHQQLVTK